MQGTVARFDDESRSGAVFLDDGLELAFDASALEGTGLRLLRPGQRVRLELSQTQDGNRVEHLQILTLA